MSHYAQIYGNKAKKTVYIYGMRLRGFSPGCQPMNGYVERRDDPTGKYYDLLVYNRRLTEQEMRAFELDFIGIEKLEESK